MENEHINEILDSINNHRILEKYMLTNEYRRFEQPLTIKLVDIANDRMLKAMGEARAAERAKLIWEFKVLIDDLWRKYPYVYTRDLLLKALEEKYGEARGPL